MEASPLIAVLAGGESRRMGTDKAGLVWQGTPLLERTCRAAVEAAGTPERVLVVGREHPAGWTLYGVRFAPDEMPGQGPLGGLATALRLADGADCVAVACDMPGLTVGALRWLMVAAPSDAEHGAVTVNGGQWEPLFALYRPACAPLVEARLASGRRSLHGLIEAGRFAFLDAPPEVRAALVNVNTPEEFAAFARSRNTWEGA
jgi:molybdopterin-guanine dinucleotide biosynthesis protein A